MTSIALKQLISVIRSRRDLLTESIEISELIREMRPAAKRGYLKRSEFLKICRRKSLRRYAEAERNDDKHVRAVTRIAYAVSNEYVRIGLLTALRGVGVPTASALLAWVYPKRFGVIDTNAWQVLHKFGVVTTRENGLGLQASQWIEYHEILQELAQSLGTTPRLIDHWLWGYFNENYSKKAANKRVK